MIRLEKDQIIALHNALIAQTGGMEGIRDEALLEAAVSAPFQTFDNSELFPSVQQKAARLGYGLIRNHAFVDGNKRIGAHAMLVLLALNGIELAYSQDELTEIVLKTAADTASFEDLLQWLLAHQK